jgi:hypothetical protein
MPIRSPTKDGIDHSSDSVDDHFFDLGNGEGLDLTGIFLQYHNLQEVLSMASQWTGKKLLLR